MAFTSVRIRIISILLLTGVLALGMLTTGSSSNNTINATSPISFLKTDSSHTLSDAWKNKVSSDIIQLIDPAACPPGRTTADIARDMERFGQLRYDDQNQTEIHITITLLSNSRTQNISSLLNQSIVDPSFGLITGWVHPSEISNISRIAEVREIQIMLPPAGSGLIDPHSAEEYLPLDPAMSTHSASHISCSLPGDSVTCLGASCTSEISSDFLNTSTWKEKLSTDLLQLLDDRYLSPGQSSGNAADLMFATGELRKSGLNASEVMVNMRVEAGYPSGTFLPFFKSALADSQYGRISGWLPVSNLSTLAQEPGVISIMAQLPAFTSQVTTKGDELLYTREFRNITNITGSGVKVGIISDGVESISSAITEGELPADVHVLRNSVGGDEGTAMLQIVHDIAPDAELYFYDRGSSQIEFVQAMDRLISAGCQIICDDITYVEPFFEDGYIARNIRDRILSYGILYVTSAGNFAQEHYQAPFAGYQDRGYAWHDFHASEGSKDLKFTAPPQSAGHVILQWDDRFGESSDNYDLFLYNAEKREIGRSVKIQDGDDDPMEYCRFINEEDCDKDYFVRVVQAGGENRTIELYVLPIDGNSVKLDPCVPEDSIFGQQAVSEAISVAAIMPLANQTVVEPYSSRGPVTIKFPSPALRQKPEISAPDGVFVSTGPGQQGTFSGTSASAPHIAALGALLWSTDPNLKEEQIRKKLINSSPLHNESWNPAIGYGVPDARLLLSGPLGFAPESTNNTTKIITSRSYQPREMEQPETLSLYPGWNMISIPYPLKNGKNNGEIFSAINTTSHTIWRYSVDQRHWQPVGCGDELDQMDVIWVYSANRTGIDLQYDDSRVNMTARHLTPGWNPLGIPGRNTLTAKELLSPLGSAWSYILVYDPRIQQYRPAMVNGGSGAYSDERLLYPTEGFWIYMNSQGIIIP